MDSGVDDGVDGDGDGGVGVVYGVVDDDDGGVGDGVDDDDGVNDDDEHLALAVHTRVSLCRYRLHCKSINDSTEIYSKRLQIKLTESANSSSFGLSLNGVVFLNLKTALEFRAGLNLPSSQSPQQPSYPLVGMCCSIH